MAIPGERFVLDLSDNDNDNRNDVARKLAAGSLIGEIKERTPKTPSAPVLKSTATGFPVPKNRTGRSAFKQQRQNNQSAHVARTTTTKKQTSPPQVESLEAEEKRIIDEENKQRLASMSEAEIAREKAELMANLSPSLIERLLRRANIDDEQDQTPVSAPREEARGTDLSGNKSKDKTKSVSFETSAPESLSRTTTTTAAAAAASNINIEDRPPAVHPADLRPASEIPSGPIHFPTPPPRQTPMPNLDPTSPSFYDDLQTHYFPDTPHDSAMLSWLKPREESADVSETDASRLPAYHPASSTTQIVPSAIRFSFRGEMLPPSTSLELPTSLGLHHHADDPEAAGYTISELSILSRSIVPAQRCVAWQVLGRILFRLGMGEFGADDFDLVDGLWKVIELEGVVSRMLEEAEGGPQRTDQEGESHSAGKSNIGRHASAKAWAVEGIWLWQKGGGKRGITNHS